MIRYFDQSIRFFILFSQIELFKNMQNEIEIQKKNQTNNSINYEYNNDDVDDDDDDDDDNYG